MPSHLSVSHEPEGCLRVWYSFIYLQILPFHMKFYPPLSYSSILVLKALPKVSFGLSLFNCKYCLRVLYAQSFWITLALLVLPRLLAQGFNYPDFRTGVDYTITFIDRLKGSAYYRRKKENSLLVYWILFFYLVLGKLLPFLSRYRDFSKLREHIRTVNSY